MIIMEDVITNDNYKEVKVNHLFYRGLWGDLIHDFLDSKRTITYPILTITSQTNSSSIIFAPWPTSHIHNFHILHQSFYLWLVMVVCFCVWGQWRKRCNMNWMIIPIKSYSSSHTKLWISLSYSASPSLKH